MTILSNDQSHPSRDAENSRVQIAVHRVLPAAERAADGSGSFSKTTLKTLKNHLDRFPGEALLLLTPGLDIRETELEMLRSLAAEARRGEVYTALSNAVADLNPFADTNIETIGDTDTSGLVSLLGTGEVFEVHRMPSHLLLIPVPTLELLASEITNRPADPGDILEKHGKLLLHDRIFVADPSVPLNAAPSLSSHEEFRPAPWGCLNQRIDEWLQDETWLKQSSHVVDAYHRACLAGDSADLHITHSWGGGVARWVESFIDSEPERNQFRLQSEGPRSGDGAGQKLSLYLGNLSENAIASWWLEPIISSTVADHPQYQEIISYIVARYGISRVIVSSLVGHSLDALRIDLPTIEVLHDFYPAWPLLDIHPQGFLMEQGADLSEAMEKHELLPDFRGRGSDSWKVVARLWWKTIQDRQVRLAAPSQSVADLMPRLYPEFSNLVASVIPHGITENWTNVHWQPRPRDDGKLKLLIPGRIQKGKGKSLLLKA
ncbi:MAG TPA: hypothetical protein VJ984_16540, partial [Xanthomonadales bacterium]|nr:hypothetical protein [Xanthomonadales bacterium]